MSQLATIFEKIREDFFENHLKPNEMEKYDLIFSPFSTGFTYDDFLFLDSNMAEKNALRYLDELLEFSQIANTIPRESNYWAVSDHSDYLFHPYRNILSSLKLMDMDTLTVEMLYDHPIFLLALNAIDEKLNSAYRPFFEHRSKLVGEIEELKKNLMHSNRIEVHSQIKIKEECLLKLRESWTLEGSKKETEEKVLSIVKDEFKRFLKGFIEIKGRMEASIREHVGSGSTFYLTSCSPNNLYRGELLKWKKIILKKPEINQLAQKDCSSYETILGSSEFTKLEVDSISFELLFANVVRPWFDESILKSPYWDINVLNKADINIPRITSKLVFVRNVDVKLQGKSAVNKVSLTKKTIDTIGPFVVQKQSVNSNGRFRLCSVNKSLQLDRATVLRVGSKLKRKTRAKDLKSVIIQKQRQFTKLAPRLKSSVRADRPKARSKPVYSARGFRYEESKKARATVARATRNTWLKKEKEESRPLESLQLIGVVSKQITSFPNPIQGADYL
nr:hypothetical protein [Allomuricauda sp.]